MDGLNVGSAWVELGVNLERLHTGLTEATSRLTTWAEQAEKRLKPFKDSALLMGGAFASLTAAAGLSAKTFGDFEAKLNGVASVSSATEAELEQVKAAALQMGADTQFSASQAADGFYELGKAGFTVSEQMATMPGVVALAAAAQISIGEAAENTAGILRGFGLDAGSAVKVADELAQAANASAVDVGDLGESFKYIAPVAKASNQSLEEMNGILAVLGNNMIKGSQAGTTIRAALVALQSPSGDGAATLHKLGISIQDTHGKMLPLTDVIQQLRDKTASMTETQKSAAIANIFGQESLSGIMALMNQAPGSIERMVKSMKDADGASKKMADGLNKGVNFGLQQLGGSIETAAIKFGNDLAPAINAVLGVLTGLVNALASAPAPVRGVILVVGGLAAGLTGLAAAVGAFGALLPSLTAGLAALGIELNVVAAGVGNIMRSILAVNPIILAMAVAVGVVIDQIDKWHQALDDAAQRQDEFLNKTAKVSTEGAAAWAKHGKGIKLTANEARAATLYLKQLAAEATDPKVKARMIERAKAMQAVFEALKADKTKTTDGVERGAVVADPKGDKKAAALAAKTAKAQAAAAAKAKREALAAAGANLDESLADNKERGGGYAGEVSALKVYRGELVRLEAAKAQIAKVDKRIADASAKAKSDKGEKTIRESAAKALRFKEKEAKFNDDRRVQLRDEVSALNDYLAVLKKHKGTAEEIRATEAEIRDLKKEQRELDQQRLLGMLDAAKGGVDLFAGAAAAGDQAREGKSPLAVPGAIAGMIGQIGPLVQQFAQGLVVAIPILTAALPALAPALAAVGTAAAGLAAGGFAALLPVVATIAALLTLFALAWQQDAGAIQEAFAGLVSAVEFVWSALAEFLQPVIDSFAQSLAWVASILGVVFTVVGFVLKGLTWLVGVIGAVLNAMNPFKDVIAAVVGVFRSLWDGLVDLIEKVTFGAVKLTKSTDLGKSGAEETSGEQYAREHDVSLGEAIAIKMGKTTGAAVKEALGTFTSFNPLPVQDVAKGNFFAVGPVARFFQSNESRVRLDLTVNGTMDKQSLLELANDPQVKRTLAAAVGAESSAVNMIPRFA